MLYKALFAATVMASSGAWATECLFTTECYDGEACTFSEFMVEISGDASTLLTEFGDLAVDFHDLTAQTNTYLAYEDSAAYLLTLDGANAARLSVHMTDAAAAITYLGSCTEMDG